MTHTGPIPESAGSFDDAKPVETPCPKCSAKAVTAQEWESGDGAYDDWKFTCGNCGHVWWVEGADS